MYIINIFILNLKSKINKSGAKKLKIFPRPNQSWILTSFFSFLLFGCIYKICKIAKITSLREYLKQVSLIREFNLGEKDWWWMWIMFSFKSRKCTIILKKEEDAEDTEDLILEVEVEQEDRTGMLKPHHLIQLSNY